MCCIWSWPWTCVLCRPTCCRSCRFSAGDCIASFAAHPICEAFVHHWHWHGLGLNRFTGFAALYFFVGIVGIVRCVELRICYFSHQVKVSVLGASVCASRGFDTDGLATGCHCRHFGRVFGGGIDRATSGIRAALPPTVPCARTLDADAP